MFDMSNAQNTGMTPQEVALRAQAVRVRTTLKWNEDKMNESARAVARHLKEIHDDKLYRFDYPSFEDYCQKKLGITRQRAHQIIGAQNARLMLEEAASTHPNPTTATEVQKAAQSLNDRQAAEIAKVPPTKRVEVMIEAIKAPGRMTTGKIRQAKAKVIEPAAPATTTTEQSHVMVPMEELREITERFNNLAALYRQAEEALNAAMYMPECTTFTIVERIQDLIRQRDAARAELALCR